MESKKLLLEKDLLEKQSAEEYIYMYRALSAYLSAIKGSNNMELLVSSGALSFDEFLNLLSQTRTSRPYHRP